MNTTKTRHHRLVLICLSLVFPLLAGSARAQCIVEGEGIDISVCLLEMPPYVFYGVPISGDTVFLDTIAGFPDCDTVIKVSITIQDPEARYILLEHCSGDLSFFEGEWLWPGTYIDTVQSNDGLCDTIRTIDVFEKPLTTVSYNFEICAGDDMPDICTLPWDDCTLPGQNGECDTIITVNIYENPLFGKYEVIETCYGDSVQLFGQWYSAGLYFDTIPALVGCDTAYTFDIRESNSVVTKRVLQSCNSEPVEFMGEVFTQPGNYELVDSVGEDCEYVFQIEVIEKPDLEIDISPDYVAGNGSIQIFPDTLNYVWSDGYTAPSRQGLPRGEYSVTITDDDGCSVVREIEVPLGVDVSEDIGSDVEIEIAPNPNDGDFTIGLPTDHEFHDAELNIINALGQIVSVQRLNGQSNINIDLDEAPGIYFVSLVIGKTLVDTKRVLVVR